MSQKSASEAPPDLTVYVDTNCFLQLRDLSDVNWKDLAPEASHIEIAVCSAVIRELDRFKIDRDRRKRDRSRLAIKLVEAATDSHDFITELREAHPRITLRVGIRGRLVWDEYPDLERTSPDDNIVLSALCEPIEGEKVLLSFDNNPIIRARMIGLPSRKSPVDWQLPDQPDEGDQAIAKLERELSDARTRWPKLELTIAVDAPPTPLIDFEIPQLPRLDDGSIERISQAWIHANPRKSLQNSPRIDYMTIPSLAERYSEFDIREYNSAYEKFEDATRRFFCMLNDYVVARCRQRKIDYEIRNISPLTAERLLVTFGVSEGVVLYADDSRDLKTGRVEPPKPPKVPKKRSPFDLAHHDLHSDLVNRLGPPKPRDPTSFYWQDRPATSQTSASQICEEFRAKQVKNGSYWLGLPTKTLTERVTISLSATNLPTPIEAHAILKIRHIEADWSDPSVLSLLPQWITDELSGA